MARRGSAIAGHRAIGSAPSTGSAMPPGSGPSPLAQQLASGMGVNGGARVNPTGGWGDAYGGYGLPRFPQDFTDGAFGPFSPIIPVAVDPAEPGTDQPLARREEYRVGWNLPVGQPGSEGLKLADFGTLRTLADLYSVARACIQFLKSQVSAMEWDIVPTEEAAKAMRNDKGAMKDFGERRMEAIRFFRRPDPDYFNWQSWMSAVMEEILTFDALSIVMRPKRGRGMKKGVLWSDLDSLNLVSGPTIRPLYDLNGATPRPPAPAYQQYLYGVPRVDLMTAITERDINDGRLSEAVLGRYTNSQLLYLPMVPRRWTPYGFPPIERGLIPVLTGLSKQGYQLDYFKEGTVPAVYISPGGDLTPNQIRELQDALNAIAGDQAFHHKVIVLPSGSHTEPQRPTPLADTFDDIVMTQVCSAFGVQPAQIGITPRATATAFSSPGAANAMAKQNSNTQDMTGLQPTLLFLTGIMDMVLQDVCNQDDMRFVFAGMQEEEDEETTTNLVVNQVTHALITIDEGRDKLGLQPYGLPQSSDPGFLTPTGFMFLDASLNPAPALPPGAPGQEPGQEPPQDGQGGQQGPKPPTPKQGPQNGQKQPQKPAQPQQGGKNPQQSGGTPGHAAAAAGANTAHTPDDGGVNKTAAPPPDQAPQQPAPPPQTPLEDMAQAALEAYLTSKIAGIVGDAFAGSATLLGAVQEIVGLLAQAYVGIMAKATAAAASEVAGVVELGRDALYALAQQRAETQRPFASIMVNDAMDAAAQGATEPPAWIDSRSNLYAQSLAGATNQAYGATVAATDPQRKIVWRLGETEHCPLCIARADHEYDFDSLPGYPGDGGFGGPICEGGPNCGCHLDYMEGDKVLDTLGNTQRPESVGYYAQQLSDITARRGRMTAERSNLVAGLPNQLGDDMTSAQSRAQSRDDMRQQLASLANQRIRSSGGYGGVSIEPSDIPASLIASLIPQYGPIPADVPITSIMDAVDSMFAAKFASADVTRATFGSMILGAVGDTVSGWNRAVAAEMEACARHLEKGRAAESWEPRKITRGDVAALADVLQTGAVSRADAVKNQLAARRYVDNSGVVYEPHGDGTHTADDFDEPSPQQGGPTGDPAGGGGYVKLPHDADGIYHDTYALVPALKGAADPGDPNPVDAEHVYNFMLQRFPPKALKWVKDARWIGPVAVDSGRVDTDDQDSWAASSEPERVKHFEDKAKDGRALKPGVVVQEPGDDKVVIIDGHHRFMGSQAAGKPFMAYVGFVDSDGGPWDETHAAQLSQGADPQNKSAETPALATVHRPLGTHGLWGDKLAQLPAYVQNIAHAMIRDGHDESEAIQLAIGAVKRWAAGEGKVTPEVQAAATAAVAEWEKLKLEHSKTKAAVSGEGLDFIGKVGPHGYIHGWIFVGVPGVGDAVQHPEHGKGVITSHGESHVTVRFANGEEHLFQVHRDASESGHFAKRGDVEHPGVHMPDPADRVMRDASEIENLSDNDLEKAREGLLKKHEEIGVWGDDADKMDALRSKVQREIYDRGDARARAADLADAVYGPNVAKFAGSDDLRMVLRDRERQAREQHMDPDRMRGHRAARVELARRADPDPKNWSVDKLHIFGGSPAEQMRTADTMKTLTADIPPERAALLQHIKISDEQLPDKRHTEGMYEFDNRVLHVNPTVYNSGSSSLEEEKIGWYSKSGHPTTLQRVLDHEMGHHLDGIQITTPSGQGWNPEGMKGRAKLFQHVSEVIGDDQLSNVPSDPAQHLTSVNGFVGKNKAEIVNNVGTYAATNHWETVAELWTQYHGQKLNGKLPTDDSADMAGQIMGNYLAGHSTETTRLMGVE